LEKKLEIVTEENAKLKRLAKSQVENIIEPAAKKGDVGAIQVVGECYQHGLGGKKKDEKQAIEYYEKGVSANSPASQCSLGKILLEQKDDVKVKERGVDLLKKSAAADYPAGQHELACCLWDGNVVPEDLKGAVELWGKAANTGFAKSQYKLGVSCDYAFAPLKEDMKQAEQWYLKASESGCVAAQVALGRMYADDENLKDHSKAIEWYEKAYYNGDAEESLNGLCELFRSDKAIEWLYRRRLSSSVGFWIEKTKTGPSLVSTIKGLNRFSIHEDGAAVAFHNLATDDDQHELVLFRRSALLGYSDGQFRYAELLHDSHPSKLKYLRLAATNPQTPEAQWELGMLYETGRCGLEKNAVLANEWKDKALANGYNCNSDSEEDQESEEEEDQ
jgi:TPR repeat protein